MSWHPSICYYNQIIILYFIILISIMGCCDSKLLGLESTSDKYQSPAIGLNLNYVSPKKKKQLASIGLAKEKEQKQNTDRCSIRSLKSGLDIIFHTFQQEKGPITYTFLDKPTETRDYSIQLRPNAKQNNLEISQSVASGKKSFSDTDFNSQNGESDQSNQVSDFYQNNTKILSNASIKTKRLLQKELFYINSSQIGGTKLLKWVEQGRLAFDLKQKDLIQVDSFKMCPTLIAALLLICYYEQKNNLKLLALKQLQGGVGFRVFVNGIKRMLKLQIFEKQINSLIQNVLRKLQKFKSVEISNWIHILTGWIPQKIDLTMFPDTAQIFKRLAKNYSNGNLIISFEDNDSRQYLLVKDVNIEEEKICIIRFSNVADEPQRQVYHQQWLSWNTVSEQYQNLNVNWNPLIYSFTKKVQGLSSSYRTKQGVIHRSKPTYLIDVPPSKSEVEVRLLIQIHHTDRQRQNNFSIHLYENQAEFVKSEQQTPIRSAISNNPTFLSEIFIFEKSYEDSQYILVLDLENTDESEEDIQLTIDFYTFCQINIKTLTEPQLLSNLQIESAMTQLNAGYGMNSPFFNKNLHYSFFAPKDGICKIKVTTQTQCPMTFQVCLLPDNNNYKDITLIRPEQLVRDIIQSDEFEVEGTFEFPCSQGRYILMLVCFTRTQGLVKINIQNYSNYQSIQNNQTQTLNQFQIVQLTSNLTFFQQIQFEWKSQCPGPRKRTKSNCESIYYPIFTFDKFFQNPFVDYVLTKGLYQFSIISKSFADSCQPETILNQNEDINVKILSSTPPSLSMGIFELSKGKTQAKIILDDYQYIPYGIGFWTAPLELEGQHRFVFSKMERGKQRGMFKIRKIGNI